MFELSSMQGFTVNQSSKSPRRLICGRIVNNSIGPIVISISKDSTGRAGGFEGLANPKGGALIGGVTNQSPFALPEAL